MKQFPFRSGPLRWVGVERLFPISPVANERGWDSAMKQFPFRSGPLRWVGVKRLFPVSPVANEGLYIEEYT